MTKHRHKQHGAVHREEILSKQRKDVLEPQAMTPGRAPAEGPAIDSPTHERWEQGTPDRDPAEGPDFDG